MNFYTILFFIVVILIDLYLYRSVKKSFFSRKWHSYAYLVASAFTISILLYYVYYGKDAIYHSYKIFLFGTAQSILFSKIFLLPFVILSDLTCFINVIIQKTTSSTSGPLTFLTKKWKQLGVVIAVIFFATFIYGMGFGAYHIEKRYVEVDISGLPAEMEGLKIVQVSDLHLGSFPNTSLISQTVEMINEENADLFFFTGDLVNDKANEILPFKNILSNIKATYGKFAVLGNHDYSNYIEWTNEEDKKENLRLHIQLQKDMGWDVLLNEHRSLDIQGKRLDVLGVEYWGRSKRWGQYGDIDLAYEGTDGADLKILLTHDPSHWDLVISQDEKYGDIALSTAGHTHGFQFGIDFSTFKWSPSQWIYPHWAGLYSDENQHLYVNRGLGFLGYPGRVGIAPEITIITLKSSDSNYKNQ